MNDFESLVSFFLGIIAILISLIIPLPVKEEYRLFIIVIIFFITLLMILSKFNSNIKDIQERIEELDKRFKTSKEFEDIRLDLRELKKEILK